MPTIIRNVQNTIVRLLLLRVMFYVTGVLATSILSALSGMDWATSTPQTKFMVIVGVAGSVAATIGAFLDTSAQKLAKGEIPFADVANTLASGSTPPFPPGSTVRETSTAQVVTETKTP